MFIKGSLVALVTPMSGGESPDSPIDEASLEGLLEFHIREGTNAIIIAGTTGESATLSHEEHKKLLQTATEQVNGRLPVLAGTGSNSTQEAISLTQDAADANADACLLVTPYYNKPTQEGLFRHYMAIADAVTIPQILYNVPGRTACDMLPETVARLAGHENIVGLKEASLDKGRISQLRQLCGDDFMLFSGEDAMAMDFMLAGGDGVISVTANIAPARMARLCERALAGDREIAERENKALSDLHEALFIDPNPIPAKWALHKMKRIDRGIRLPMTWLDDEVKQASVVRAMGLAGID